MKTKLMMLVAIMAACGTVASCGGDDKETLTSTPITTARALDRARVPLDTVDPEETNNGSVSFSDTSDTADPIEASAQ